MQFALLGDHPDGLDMAVALVRTGRHQLKTFCGPAARVSALQKRGLTAKVVPDLEEVLADPAVEAVIVAGGPSVRAGQLRRALQSERHVLCVFPPDDSADIAYEAAMIQKDTRKVLFPLLTAALHPGIIRLAEISRDPAGPLGEVQLLEMENCGVSPLPMFGAGAAAKAGVPGWDVLRFLSGEIAEVSAMASSEELAPDAPLLVAGKFENKCLFQASFVPKQAKPIWRLAISGTLGKAELSFPLGWQGTSFLVWRDTAGELKEEFWQPWNSWPKMAEVFQSALDQQPGKETWRPNWEDAVRCMELDDAARRSVEKRRASTLDYQEASEEVGFKGTMTLVGCGMLWVMLLLVVLSRWFPKLGWIVLPLLIFFLAMQLLRWVVPSGRKAP